MMQTDWMSQGCTYENYWFPLYPSRVPVGEVKAYYWNEKCLVAPKPYFDDEGYYYWRNWVIRKVVPGLLSMPTGFIGFPKDNDMAAALGSLIRNTSKAVDELLQWAMGADPKPEWDITEDGTHASIPSIKKFT